MTRIDLHGKVAIVTGGGGGIGGATSRLLAERGAAVVVADIDASCAGRVVQEIAAAGGQATSIRVDVLDETQIQAMVERAIEAFGRLDIMVNNAALCRPEDAAIDIAGSVQTMTSEMWDLAMGVNLRGPMLCTKHALGPMLARGAGSVINISSVASLQGRSTLTAYAVSKAALNALTQCVATAYGKQGIRCNAVLPGFTLTPNGKKALSDEDQQGRLKHSLLAELGDADDIANMVAFLASDQARIVTGQLIPVDGGVTVHAPWFADEEDHKRKVMPTKSD